jgi:regulation of enolase protein 1 (concanavalin A-like superfamily)
MKQPSILVALILFLAAVVSRAELAHSNFSSKPKKISGWGKAHNPDGDCQFFTSGDDLLISVPATNGPHDLAAEINVVNAPRVLRSVRGDFVVQVCVDGRMLPGGKSTLSGRIGYNGAGLVVMSDDENVICLARAFLQDEDEQPRGYANFEMRNDAKLDHIGMADQHSLPLSGPVFLRLERRGDKVIASTSLNGEQWRRVDAKRIPARWDKELQVGVVAISTSKEEFNPKFSKFKLGK